MKVLTLSKHIKCTADNKSQRTTQVNSYTHSKKNSAVTLHSKPGDKIIIPSQIIGSGFTGRQKKTFMNITIRNNNVLSLQSQRSARQPKKDNNFRFNFCQQVPKDQNFYTKIISQDQSRFQNFKEKQQRNKAKSEMIIEKKARSTLTSFQSPINKLMQLNTQSNEQNKVQSQQFAVELQNLLNQL